MTEPLIRNITTQGSLEGEFYFSLFNKYIQFCVERKAGIEYVRSCVEYLNSLDGNVINALCLASIRYRDEFSDMIGEETVAFSNPRDVLSQIIPKILIVPNPENSDEPVAHLELDCEWEEEHGMEWIIRGSSILYVGGYNGQNPWMDYSDKDSWNYA